jgi:hypothetical protein
MMKTLLLRRTISSISPSVISITKNLKTIFLATVMMLGFSFQAQAQEPKVIKGWNHLEEAEFVFDVYYQIVECIPLVSPTEIHLWAFNEGGKVDAVGFTLTLRDADGTEVTHTVEKFEIGLGQSYKAECGNDAYPYLKFALPSEIDVETMTIDITYNK